MTSTCASAPTLFVRNVERTAAFYGVKLGFAVIFPARAPDASLIVICRGGDQLRFRAGGDTVHEVRPSGAPRWHARIHVPDPDALAADFLAHGLALSAPLCDRPDGQRGFEIVDPDGHVLLFATAEIRAAAAPLPETMELRPPAKGMGWLVQGWGWGWVEVAAALAPAA